jgi:hypothetical protein
MMDPIKSILAVVAEHEARRGSRNRDDRNP